MNVALAPEQYCVLDTLDKGRHDAPTQHRRYALGILTRKMKLSEIPIESNPVQLTNPRRAHRQDKIRDIGSRHRSHDLGRK